LLDCELSHSKAHEIDSGSREQGRVIGSQALPGNQNGLLLQVRTSIEERLRNENGSSTTIGSRAALELSERRVDHRSLENLVQGVDVLELRVWVSLGMLVVHTGNLSEILRLSAISKRPVSIVEQK
jgi:hypothetical protein